VFRGRIGVERGEHATVDGPPVERDGQRDRREGQLTGGPALESAELGITGEAVGQIRPFLAKQPSCGPPPSLGRRRSAEPLVPRLGLPDAPREPGASGGSETAAEFAPDGDGNGDGGEREHEGAAVAAELPVEREVADCGDHREQQSDEREVFGPYRHVVTVDTVAGKNRVALAAREKQNISPPVL